jgi:hypothetical protein
MTEYNVTFEVYDLENYAGAIQVDTDDCNSIIIINNSTNAFINVNGVPIAPTTSYYSLLQFRGNENEVYNGKLIISEGKILGIGVNFKVNIIKKIFRK